jgi:protocatechuate 3,4-dioxygenase beta subunit
MSERLYPNRRRFLVNAGALAAGYGAVLPQALLAQGLAPTPACQDGDEPTLPQTEGPFFTPNSPQRSDLREEGGSRPAELSGFVLSRRCRPVAGALVNLWHADERGDYDNKGFRYRGHVFTGADGSFRFRTIVPGLYRPRTRHYHVKVQARGGRVLTTQLYFPGEPGNACDFLFRRELLMRTAMDGTTLEVRFDFVLDMG